MMRQRQQAVARGRVGSITAKSQAGVPGRRGVRVGCEAGERLGSQAVFSRTMVLQRCEGDIARSSSDRCHPPSSTSITSTTASYLRQPSYPAFTPGAPHTQKRKVQKKKMAHLLQGEGVVMRRHDFELRREQAEMCAFGFHSSLRRCYLQPPHLPHLPLISRC